jgi:hypothetical protein
MVHLHETLVTKSGFFVMEMSKNSPTSICSSKKFFRLASARHVMEDKGGVIGMAGKGRGEGERQREKGRKTEGQVS